MHINKGIRYAAYLIFFGILAGLPGYASEKGQDLNRAIANVNGISIFNKDLLWAVSSKEQHMISTGQLVDQARHEAIEKETLDELISTELLFQESRRKGIIVPDAEVDDKYNALIEAIPRDLDLERISDEMGLSEADIKNEFRRAMSVQRLMDMDKNFDNQVSDDAIRAYYDANPGKFTITGPTKVSHILIKVDHNSKPEKKAMARRESESILEKIKAGEDFSELAKAYSHCPSKINGGDIGYIKKGQTVKPFEDAAFSLKQGQVSDIVETRFGYHILKIMDKKPETRLEFDEVKTQVSKFLNDEKTTRYQNNYVNKLKQAAVIEFF